MQTVTIDLIPQKEKPIVKLSQYDNDRQVRFMLEENGETYTLAGTETVEVNIRKPDRNIVVIAPTIGANAYVDVLFTEQAAACFGESFGELSIKSGETVIGTCNFIIDVEISPIYGGIDSATEINNLETQIEEIITEVLSDDYYTKTETDDLLDAKADASDVYTKTQTDTLLNAKVDASDVYTKTQTDTLLSAKADASDVYTKTQTDTLLSAKADASDVYTKTQTDTLLSAKADASDVYTKTEVDNIILDIMPVDTATGPIATFDTELAVPLVNVSCEVVATGGNGTPDSPIPINGHTEANITRCGVNIWDEEWELGTFMGGVLQPSTTRIRNKTPIPVKPNTTYRLVKPSDTVYVMQIDKATGWTQYSSSATSGTFTTTSWCNYLYISPDTTYGTTYNNNISINYPSSDTSYHPYTGNTYTIAFGQTVYGGVLDVKRGKLHVTWGIFDLGTLNYTRTEEGGIYTFRYPSFITGKRGRMEMLCTEYSSYYGSRITIPNLNICKGNFTDSTTLCIRNDAYTDTTAFKASMNGVMLAYELATPFDIDLTPEVISAVVGTNNVYSDTNGDTTVQFKDSIQHYIDTRS